MSFEAVLGNKEFEVSEVTMTVVTRSSTSGGHGVSVLESVTGTAMVGRTLFKAKNSFTSFINVYITLGQ
jgi:hypothetical protein